MIKLSAKLLDLAVNAIVTHGYGDFFPDPPELNVVLANWDDVRAELSELDLDTYRGYDHVAAFAPKSRLNIRRVVLLHPYDLLLYTALVLALRDGISKFRLRAEEKRVFSYRAERAGDDVLYNDSPSYTDFKDRVTEVVNRQKGIFVGVSDIADFYPRIYHHRLVNALQACCGRMSQDYIRALEKMLARFSDGASYGIPIGPAASRPLGEATLIDVDSTLMSYHIDFVRFTDDYVIFADSPEGAEYGIRVLAETLFLNHGLTLQTAKTKVLPGSEYVRYHLAPHSEKEEGRRKLLEIVGGDEYKIPKYEDLDEDQKKEVDALNLSEMLQEALAEGHNVDYREVSFILGRLSALRMPELIPIVLDNLERLNPVAHSIAAFFREFTKLNRRTREKVTSTLLNPILNDRTASEYYSVWVLSLFHDHPDWDHAEDLIRIFREAHSDVVRRFAALALATSGTRAEAIQMTKHLGSASSLSRTAILMATSKMGTDERKHLQKSLRLGALLEKYCMQT